MTRHRFIHSSLSSSSPVRSFPSFCCCCFSSSSVISSSSPFSSSFSSSSSYPPPPSLSSPCPADAVVILAAETDRRQYSRHGTEGDVSRAVCLLIPVSVVHSKTLSFCWLLLSSRNPPLFLMLLLSLWSLSSSSLSSYHHY